MLELKIYKDEYLAEVQEVRKVDGMRIPYRTADAVTDMLAELDFANVDGYKVLELLLKNKRHITTVVRATFGLTEDELARVDIMDMYSLAKEAVQYVMGQMAELGGESDPNAKTLATATR